MQLRDLFWLFWFTLLMGMCAANLVFPFFGDGPLIPDVFFFLAVLAPGLAQDLSRWWKKLRERKAMPSGDGWGDQNELTRAADALVDGEGEGLDYAVSNEDMRHAFYVGPGDHYRVSVLQRNHWPRWLSCHWVILSTCDWSPGYRSGRFYLRRSAKRAALAELVRLQTEYQKKVGPYQVLSELRKARRLPEPPMKDNGRLS